MSNAGRVRSRACRFAVLVVYLAGVSACTATPTSPSATGGGLTLGPVAQEPASVPSAVVPAPAQALGATRFLAFGDSITAGVLSEEFDNIFIVGDHTIAYPGVLEHGLNTYNVPRPFTVANRGVPGETARVGVDRLPAELSTHRPQVVLLLEGINDLNFGVPVNQVAANVQTLVQIARLFNCTVLIATMPQTYRSYNPNTGRERLNSTEKIVPFNNEVRRLVAGLPNVHIVDVYGAFGSDRSMMGPDGLHPTAAGYQRMAQTFYDRIRDIFPVRGSLQ